MRCNTWLARLSLALLFALVPFPAWAGKYDDVFAGSGRRTVTGTMTDTNFSFVREGKTIGPFDRSEWRAFLKEALQAGLVEAVQAPDVVRLTFRDSGLAGPAASVKGFNFPPHLSSYMRKVTRLGERPDGRGPLILVHEPHSDTRAQHNLIEGLRALADANRGREFVFLVEGEFDSETREIATEPLLKVLDDNPENLRIQVYYLLDRYLIDGPLAYRLLYAPKLKAFAIDDAELVKRSPPRRTLLLENFQPLSVMAKVLEKQVPDERRDLIVNELGELGKLKFAIANHSGAELEPHREGRGHSQGTVRPHRRGRAQVRDRGGERDRP